MKMSMLMRQNTRLHTICKMQVNVNIPKYKCVYVNAAIRMFTLVNVNIPGYKYVTVNVLIYIQYVKTQVNANIP